MRSNEQLHIIDPEIPDTPADKLHLLRRCLAVIAEGGIVQGLTPRHVAQEGMHMVKNAQASQDKRAQSLLENEANVV